MSQRMTAVAAAPLTVAAMVTGVLPEPLAVAAPQTCNDAFCTPGITPNVVLGSYCSNTTYFVYGTTSWGRLVFCGSPRRYEPRWFRSPPMHGIKDENTPCDGYLNDVAQAPDGMVLSCVPLNGASLWRRGDA